MREIKIAKCVIRQNDSFLLQLRDFEANKGAINLLGSFGGKIEEGETPIQAVVRELSEETNIVVDADELKEIGNLRVQSDKNNEEAIILSTVFYLKLDDSFRVKSYDGKVIRINKDEINNSAIRMTPATKAAFEQLINNKD